MTKGTSLHQYWLYCKVFASSMPSILKTLNVIFTVIKLTEVFSVTLHRIKALSKNIGEKLRKGFSEVQNLSTVIRLE